MRGMRVPFRVAVRMMHPVHNGVGAGIQERGTLRDEGEEIEEPLPEPAHGEHPVRRVSVQEECLTEEREEPVTEKKESDSHK